MYIFVLYKFSHLKINYYVSNITGYPVTLPHKNLYMTW